MTLQEKYSYNNLPTDITELGMYLWLRGKDILNEKENENLLIMYQELPYYHDHIENKLSFLFNITSSKEQEYDEEIKKQLIERVNYLEKILELKLKANSFITTLL